MTEMEQIAQPDEGSQAPAESPAAGAVVPQIRPSWTGGPEVPAPGGALPSPRLLAEFAKEFSASASQLLGKPLTARPGLSTIRTQGEFLASVEEPTCCCALAADPADPPGPARTTPPGQAGAPAAWMELSPAMAFAMIDLLLGGSRAGGYVPTRPLTEIERRLLRRVVRLAAEAMTKVWPPPGARRFVPVDPPASAGTPRPGTPTAVATFEISLEQQVGTMRLCLAGAIRQEDSAAPSTVRQRETPLLLSVASEEVAVTAEELADLAPGDIVTTETDQDGEVIVRVAGIPKFAARLGACNGRRAITITRRLRAGEEGKSVQA